MISDQTDFLQSLGWAALNSLWQMAFLWITFQIITSLLKLKPSIKSTLASSLLFLGFVWFIYTFFSTYNSSADIAFISNGIINLQGNQQINTWFLRNLPVASIIYLSLLLFPVLRFIKNYRYVQIIRRYGLSKIDVDTRVYINKTSAHLGIKRKVQIWISELVSSPVTIGFLKPVILVPLAAINHLSPQQLEAVLLHELAHIKRNDYFINLVINIIQTILYFNPFVKVFIKITETEREKSCDELVLQFQYNSYEYAAALLELEKSNQSQQHLTLAASGNKNDLLHRVENILNIEKNNRVNIRKISGMLFTFCFIISINMVFLFSQHFSNTATTKNYAIFGVPKYLFDEQQPTQINLPENNSSNVAMLSKIVPKLLGKFADEQLIEEPVNTPAPDDFINVSLNQSIVPELNKFQEEQINSAVAASKKVLEDNQWRNVENNIADVFTQKEKEKLKAGFQKELEKFDWSQWETRLRSTYDNVNWQRVNTQLNNAVTQIKIDSLQNVYAIAALRLNDLQKELTAKNLIGMPDTDISLETIIEKKEMIERILNELKAVRSKKIVHL